MGLRKRFERFCLRNSRKGIPNLMLYVIIGNAIVTIFSLMGYYHIFELLRFDREKIFAGEVWRLFTYVFTAYAQSSGGAGILMALIVFYCVYSIGKAVEASMGTFKFNLFYLGSVLFMDLVALAFGSFSVVYEYTTKEALICDPLLTATISTLCGQYMPSLLNLSLIICFSTLYPENQFLLFFIIPIKAKLMALFYMGYILYESIHFSFFGIEQFRLLYFPLNLFPLISLVPYLLIFGSDVGNLLPLSWKSRARRNRRAGSPGVTPMGQPKKVKFQAPDFSHRCTVCGRTDRTDPELEFRYCSRCAGYQCYCQDHISNHAHIQ